MSLTSYRTAPSRVSFWRLQAPGRQYPSRNSEKAGAVAGTGRGRLARCLARGRNAADRTASRSRRGQRRKGKFSARRLECASGLCRPGSDLLSHALRRSTIGARGLNDRVRDGIGWGPPAITTRSAETRQGKRKQQPTRCMRPSRCSRRRRALRLQLHMGFSDQTDRAISTG